MNLENIFFLTKDVKADFAVFVKTIGIYVNDYTVNAKLSLLQIEVALNDSNGLIEGDFHAGGCQFKFQEYHAGNPIKFRISFDGEGKRFRVEFESNGSNPDGFISYFVEPDCTSVLHKKIRTFLELSSKKNIESIISNEIETGVNNITDLQELEHEDLISTTGDVQTQLEGIETQNSEEKEEKNELNELINIEPETINKRRMYYPKTQMVGGCACPKDSEVYELANDVEIEHISTRVRKLFYATNNGDVGIYKCEHCGNHFFLEFSESNFLISLSSKAAQYLLGMKSQLLIVVEDKGVAVIRELILRE